MLAVVKTDQFLKALVIALLIGNAFSLTAQEDGAVSQATHEEAYTRGGPEAVEEFLLGNGMKVGAKSKKYWMTKHCSIEPKMVDDVAHFDLKGDCYVISLLTIFEKINVNVLDHTMIAGKVYKVYSLTAKKDQEMTIKTSPGNGLDLIKSPERPSVFQYLNIHISLKSDRKFYIEFRYILSVRLSLAVVLRSTFNDPETFTANGSFSSVKKVADMVSHMGISEEFLSNENIDFSKAMIHGQYYATYKPDEIFEFAIRIDNRNIGFMHPIDHMIGFLFIQQTFGDIELEPSVALVFVTNSRTTILEVARNIGYQTEANIFNPSRIERLAVTCSIGKIDAIQIPNLMRMLQFFTTTETKMLIPKGMNLLMRYLYNGRLPDKVIFHGNLGNKLEVTTEANITTDVKSIVDIFKTIQPNMETNYRKIESSAPGKFWKAEIQKDGVANIKINVSSALSILEPATDIKNLTWSFNFGPTRNSLTANGENYVAGEVTSTHLEFSGSTAMLTGELRRAFSVKQLLANVGITPTYMVGFGHLIIPLISNTKFEIDLSASADDRMLAITADSTVIGCTEEKVLLSIKKSSDTLLSGLQFKCSSSIYIHEAMRRVFLKDVVREQWVLLKYININLHDVSSDAFLRQIDAEAEQLTTCPFADGGLRDQQSLCTFLKNRLKSNGLIKIGGGFNQSDFYFKFIVPSGRYISTLKIDLTAEPLISHSLALINAVPFLSYANGESTFEIRCTIFLNAGYLFGNAKIKTLGQGKPYITITLKNPASNIMGNTWVRLEKGAHGYGVINPAKPLKIVFTNGVTIGAATPESAKTFDHAATVTLGDGIKPRLVAHSNDHDTIPMTLGRFGAIDYHNSLEGIHFINGYTIRYCGTSQDPEDICSLPGHSVTHNSKLMVTGKIFYLHATIDVNIYASDSTLVIEGTTEIINASNGKVKFQRENEDGTGPRFYLASVNREGGVGKAIFKGHLYAEGITYVGEMGYVQRPGKTLPSLMAEGITCSWHGEVDSFEFKVFLDPNPTFTDISYEIQANRKENAVVDTHHMKETLKYYVEMIDKIVQELKTTENEAGLKQKSLHSLMRDAETKLLATDDRLRDLVDVLNSLEPTLEKECVDQCETEHLFGIHDSDLCPEDHLFRCLEWKNLEKTVVDYICVANCEAKKIISRDTLNQNWKTAQLMLPKYRNILALSSFLEEQQTIVYTLQQKIQSYVSTIHNCIGTTDDNMENFEDHYATYNIEIKQLSSTIKMEDRINVEKKCYTFQMIIAYNGEDRSSQFEGCLNGEFQKRIDLEVFKNIGMDMLEVESCLLSTSKYFAAIYKDTESLVRRIDDVLAQSEDFENIPSHKRGKIPKEMACHLELYRQKFSAPARSVDTMGEKTTAAFANSVPWVFADNLDRIKTIGGKTRDRIFNSTYLPAAQMDCQQSRNAIDTYQKLSSSLYSLTQSYRNGKEAINAYSRSLDSKLDNIEMSLFQKYAKLKPGPGALRDMRHWIKESRKGNILHVEDLKRSLEYQNRNGIPNLKHQVQNYVAGVDQKLSSGNYLTSLAGVVDASQKRFKIAGNEQPSQIKNLVELFSQNDVTVEDASQTISDLWDHSQKFSQIKLKC